MKESSQRHPTRCLCADPWLIALKQTLPNSLSQMFHRMSRFFWNRGVIVRRGVRSLRQSLPDILTQRTDVLSPRAVRVIIDLASDWHHLDDRIETVTGEIEALVKKVETGEGGAGLSAQRNFAVT